MIAASTLGPGKVSYSEDGSPKGTATETSRYVVSVVTVVLNQAEALKENLRSVAGQYYAAKEHIVIDGGSTDGTVALLKNNADKLSGWLSEPDGGIADAMNKGIRKSAGDLVLFLHADDHFSDPHALSRVMGRINALDNIWACDVLFGRRESRRVRPRPFNAWARFRNPLPHQGVLFPKRLFDRIGLFDTRWRISMDYELWLRAMRAGVGLVRIPEVLSVMGSGGISSRLDWRGLQERLHEERAIQSLYKPNDWWNLIYFVFWPAYMIYRRGRSALEI